MENERIEDEKSARRSARELALRRLSLREHSARELETYLKRHEVPAQLAAEVIAELVEEKLVDDQRFARAMTRSQAVREKGPAYILQKLKQKGLHIDLNEVRSLFSETSDLSEKDLARKLIERRYPRALHDEKEFRRAYNALLRRGFSNAAAQHALSGHIDDT